MKTDLINLSFEGRSVRTVTVDDEIYWVAKDVCIILDYVDPVNAVKQHCRGVAKHHPIVDSLGRTQNARIISEPDLLRLIIGSRLPTAEKFERWVFEEVLPSIRKHGTYSIGVDTSAMLRLQSENDQLAAKLEFAERKNRKFADSVGMFRLFEVAVLLRRSGIGNGNENHLVNRMIENGFLQRDHSVRRRKMVRPYLVHIKAGYFDMDIVDNGLPKPVVQSEIVMTPGGRGLA